MKTPENTMNCKTFQDGLPDLVLTANARPTVAQAAHLRTCPPCAEEFLSFQSTFATLDAWQVPEPSAYFDQKLAVAIREEQAAPHMTWLQSLRTRLLFNTGRNFRPAMIGTLALTLMVGGGGVVGVNYLNAPPASPSASATVNDLQILDRNEQAFQQLDELQQDDQQDDNVDYRDTITPMAPPQS
jgi:hypothetical protein